VGNKSATYVYNAALTNTFTSASGGGTLEVNSSGANGAITLSDGYTVNLFNGGTLRSSGSLAANPTQSGTNFLNSTLKVSSSAALSGTISTVNSGDVFTIGNNANDFTGGASDAVVHTNGPGTIVLTQTNNYVGNLSVDKGTLVISGSLTATGTTSVLTGATLGGGGGFAGNLLVSGTVHPGVISGVPTTLSISGSATFNNGSTFKVTLDGAGGTSGSLAIGGSLSLIGTDQLTFNVLSAPTGQTFTIASYAPLTLTPGGVFVTDNTLPAGYTVIYNDAAGLVQLAPVPEPATWAMLAGSAWMLVAFRRFRRRSLG
jgi:fibronectin-binding autotransporter adhesin